MVLAVSRHAWLHGTPLGVHELWIFSANPPEITVAGKEDTYLSLQRAKLTNT
jgi:hypothetical protein